MDAMIPMAKRIGRRISTTIRDGDAEEETCAWEDVEDVEDVVPQIFDPIQVPLLHVSFTVQILESLQGVPFRRSSTKHPTLGLQVEI